MASIKLGELLLKAKVLSDSQLQVALTEQKRWGGRLGEILVRMNILTEEMLVKALSKQLNLPAVNLDSIESIPPNVKAKIPQATAREMVALPLQLRDDGRTLVVAMAEPQALDQVDTLRSISRCRIVVQIAGRNAMDRAYARFYDEAPSAMNDSEGSFKFVDAQGRTRGTTEAASDDEPVIERQPAWAQSAAPEAKAPSPTSSSGKLPGGNAEQMLSALEDAQRKEVAALKAMVELMIEKGVFTREEYLAKVRR